FISKRRISGMALLILALLQRIFLMSSLMLLLVWLIFFMVLIKLLPILGTISGKTVKLMVLALICLGNNKIGRASCRASDKYDAGFGIPAKPLFRSVHQQTQNQLYGSSHIGATAKDISNVVTDAASGVVDIFHGIDKAVADTWNNFWKDGKADGIGSNLSRK